MKPFCHRNQNFANLENYTLCHKVRLNRHGGGITIFVHDSVRMCAKIDSPFNECFESVSIVAKVKNKKICISEVYRPPNSKDGVFIESLKSLLDSAPKTDLSIVRGDFNYDLLKSHAHSLTMDFYSLMLDCEYASFILKSSRVTHKTCTLIDNIFVKRSGRPKSNSFLITDSMSDHYPCLLSLSATVMPKNEDVVI